MRWSAIKVIWFREVRDQLRDRRTVFMIVVLPIFLYPALGIGLAQFARAFAEQPMKVGVAGNEWLEQKDDPGPPAGENRFFLRQLPPLIEGNRFAANLFKAHRVNERQLLEVVLDDEQGLAELLQRGEIQAAVIITKPFVDKLKSGQPAMLDLRLKGAERVSVEGKNGGATRAGTLLSTKDERSQRAHDRLEPIFWEWSGAIVERRMQELKTPPNYHNPLQVPDIKLADRGEKTWSRLFPFLIVMMSLTGALYPAIDVCAGEKERGTMETLVLSPVSRSEIVWGKFLTVWLFSAATALLNLASMGLTALQFSSFAGRLLDTEEAILPVPGPAAVGWCVVLLLPLAAFFSSLCLALSVYARSSKEGQYYLMPLLLLSFPLTLLTVLPGIELTPLYSMVPITGAALLLQALIDAQSADQLPWLYLAPVLLPLAAYCYLALHWAVYQFSREDVLFREAERLDLRLWLRHLLRSKEPVPTAGEAVACFALIMLLRWFAGAYISGADALTQVAVTQLAFFAFPAVLMALLLTSRPVIALRLQWPQLWRPLGKTIFTSLQGSAWLMASLVIWMLVSVILAITLHGPLLAILKPIVQELPQIEQHLKELEHFLDFGAPLGWQLVVFAALPAVCEELAFRGFILSGLTYRLGVGKAILVSSLFFAFSHLNAFQFITTFTLGLVLCVLATRSGSLLPGMVFHFVHNALLILTGHFQKSSQLESETPPWIFSESGLYSWPGVLVCGGLAAVLVFALCLLRPRRLVPR